MPELGVIPTGIVTQPRRLPSPAKFLAKDIPAFGIRQDGKPGRLEFSTLEDKSSMMAESFRQTLTSILRTKPEIHTPVHVVTSVILAKAKQRYRLTLLSRWRVSAERSF